MKREAIGDALLYCGDCMDILENIGPCNLIVADPPYTLSLANDYAKNLMRGQILPIAPYSCGNGYHSPLSD